LSDICIDQAREKQLFQPLLNPAAGYRGEFAFQVQFRFAATARAAGFTFLD
jgi:hypothetical protein